MKVAGIRLLCFHIPFKGVYQTAAGPASFREGIIFQLQSDAGVTGLGETSFLPQSPEPFEELKEEAMRQARAAIGTELKDLIEDHGLCDTPTALRARTGLEIAAWDAIAQSRTLPLANILAASTRASVAVNALISATDAREAADAAARARAAGYKTVKLKVGMARTPAEEWARAAAVRQALGRDIKLRLDANGAWDVDQAIETISGLADLDIEYIEQPLAPGRLDATRKVKDAVAVPIALDEDVTSLEATRQILESHAAAVLILKPLQVGGLRASLEIMALAAEAGVKTTLTTSIDSGVGTATALHLAATVGGDVAHGLATLSLLEGSLTRPDLTIKGGRMAVPTGAGLGLDLDGAGLELYVGETHDFGSWR